MWAKLLRAMQAISNPRKDKKANAGKFSYNYADLAQVLSLIKPALYAEGLGLLQTVEYREGIPYLITSVFDENDVLKLSERRLYDYTDAQAEGSGLTYTRRYELLTVFGLAAEDDDGAPTKTAQTIPANLKEAQQFLVNAEAGYCNRHGINDARAFHEQYIITREDYSNTVDALHRIATELLTA